MYKIYHKLVFISVFVVSTFISVNCQSPIEEVFDLSKVKNQEIVRIFGNAKAYNKPVLLIFEAVWCPYCKQLNEETLQNDDVINSLGNYEKLNINVDENEEDATLFNGKPRGQGGNGIPAVIIYSPEGKKLERTTGFMESKSFISFLKRNLKKIEQTQ